MTQLSHHIHKLSFILLFTIVGCEGPTKEKCGAECKKCITDCYDQCKEGYRYCLKSATPNVRSTFENCQYYGNQCLINCPKKCMN